MIGYIEGKVKFIDRGAVVVVAGHQSVPGSVGYRVNVVGKVLVEWREKLNEKIRLYIHTYVKEDALDLYGFIKKEELVLFGMLLSVSGVGPKTALAVFDAGEVNDIKVAIGAGEVEFFTAVSGIGKKGAQRIIVDLKGKISGDDEVDLKEGGVRGEVVMALTGMGFSKKEVVGALRKVDRVKDAAEQIKQALKNLSG